MKRIATVDRRFIRRRRGRPWGSTKGLPPRSKLRISLAPETVEIMQRCAAASGIGVGQWVDFLIADYGSDGQLLAARRERDLAIREARCLVDAFTSLAHAQTIDDIIASVAKTV
jgi:hypothetical protein